MQTRNGWIRPVTSCATTAQEGEILFGKDERLFNLLSKQTEIPGKAA